MKILIVSINHAPEVTGIGKYVGEMADWLVANGDDVRIVTAPPHYPQWRVADGYARWTYAVERQGRLKVIRCPLYVPRNPGGLSRLLHLASFALTSLPAILLQAVTWRPDIVLAIEPPLVCAPTALVAARLTGARAWLHVQDFEVDVAFSLGLLRHRWARRLALALERGLLGNFDRVSTISAAMDATLAAKGVEEERRTIFPNWVDTAALGPHGRPGEYRQELGLPADVRVALYSGNLGRKQGIEVVIEAARLSREERDVVYVICGEGAERSKLMASAKDLPNIRFLPLQPAGRLNDFLNLADVHLLPQRPEAEDLVLPSKLAGMMATGRPTIASARSGTEIARAVEGAGLIVPPGDAAAFAQAVVGLCRDADARRRYGLAARERARDRWEKAVVLARAFGGDVAPASELSRTAPLEAT